MKALWLVILLAVSSSARGEDAVTARIQGKLVDDGGKPIAGATVKINRYTDFTMQGFPSSTTDAAGKYELMCRFKSGGAPVVREIWAEAKGYVTVEKKVAIKLRGGAVETLDLATQPGKIISGAIRYPLEGDAKLKDAAGVFIVKGQDFESVYVTEKGGAFEIYVPQGEYHFQIVSPRPFGIAGVKSGSRDLVLEPKPFVWSEQSLGLVFDDFLRTMDRHYSYFALKKDVDWAALREKHRPQAIQANNADQLAAALAAMLAPLRDQHIWIETPRGTVPTMRGGYSYNGNHDATRATLREATRCGDFALVGKTKKDGFGYFLMLRQSDANDQNVQQAIDAIRKLRDAPGFVVDLRSANGGSEPLAAKIARLFCAQDTVYARSKYRSGPGHDDFSKDFPRTLPASEKDPYTRPVVCLIGPGAVSSGEGFVQMLKCLPNVTTVGLPTRGASGNPTPVELGESGVAVWFSRWVDLMPDGETFEGRGIQPDVNVDLPISAYADRDPTLEKGLEVLRERLAK